MSLLELTGAVWRTTSGTLIWPARWTSARKSCQDTCRISMSVTACVCSCLRVFLSAFLLACVRVYLLACLLACLLDVVTACLHTCFRVRACVRACVLFSLRFKKFYPCCSYIAVLLFAPGRLPAPRSLRRHPSLTVDDPGLGLISSSARRVLVSFLFVFASFVLQAAPSCTRLFPCFFVSLLSLIFFFGWMGDYKPSLWGVRVGPRHLLPAFMFSSVLSSAQHSARGSFTGVLALRSVALISAELN